MSDSVHSEMDDEGSVLAAEYVLGLLEGEDRARAAERALRDRAFSAEIDVWERRFAAFYGSVPSVDPPAIVWEHIAQSIDRPANLVAFPERTRLLDRLGLWRGLTAASLLAAACVAGIVVLPKRAPSPVVPPVGASALLTATLTDKGNRPLFVATADPRTEAVIVVPIGGIAARDRTPELWVIPVGGVPRPIGLIGAEHPHSLHASPTVRTALAAKAILAVSLEPPGGSPTGAPTGPVIATGVINRL